MLDGRVAEELREMDSGLKQCLAPLGSLSMAPSVSVSSGDRAGIPEQQFQGTVMSQIVGIVYYLTL